MKYNLLKRLFALLFISALLSNVCQVIGATAKNKLETRYVRSKSIKVFETPDAGAREVSTLRYLDAVTVVIGNEIEADDGVWVKIIAPVDGYLFQRKLVKGELLSPPDPSLISEDEGVLSTDLSITDPAMNTESDPKSEPRAMWMGAATGLFVLPGQTGLSGSILSTQDFILEFEKDGTWQSNLRFGGSLANFAGATNMVSASFYGLYRYDFEARVYDGFDFFGLGGLYLSIADFSGAVSGTSSGYGMILGAGAYYDLNRHGFSELMRGGAQFIFNTGRTYVGGSSQNIGSTQIQVFAIWRF